MIVYLARAIQAFVMYCVNGTSCSSLLIESTDSYISLWNIRGGVFEGGLERSTEEEQEEEGRWEARK